jgi:hypothetical protein
VVDRRFLHSEYSAYLWAKKRADERTRTADLTSLRVIIQALQGFAGVCKRRISKPFSLLRLAACCTVLRSRWYQSGVKGRRRRSALNPLLNVFPDDLPSSRRSGGATTSTA